MYLTCVSMYNISRARATFSGRAKKRRALFPSLFRLDGAWTHHHHARTLCVAFPAAAVASCSRRLGVCRHRRRRGRRRTEYYATAAASANGRQRKGAIASNGIARASKAPSVNRFTVVLALHRDTVRRPWTFN